MKFKKSLFIICIIICFLTIASVSASDDNQIELSQNDNLKTDQLENPNFSHIAANEEKNIDSDTVKKTVKVKK